MEPGFLRSRQFVVAAAIAAVILVVGVAAGAAFSRMDDGFFGSGAGGCRERAVDGAPLAVAPDVTTSDGGEARDASYAPGAAASGVLRACVSVGEILVETSPDDQARVSVRVRGDSAEAVRLTDVRAAFARSDKGLEIAVWEARAGTATRSFGGQETAQVTLVVGLPEGARFDVDAVVGVGDLRLTGLMVGNVSASTDVGELRALALDATGDVTLETDVGSIVGDFASLQTGTLRATADVDSIELRLPSRADIGYDVAASSDVGDVRVHVGETERHETRGEGPGGAVEARSRGYDAKPTKVRVVASSDVGDVLVTI